MSRPEVTVVVPTKDRPGLLPLTLRSVLGQRDVNMEVVVVDDGSAEPIDAVVETHDPRVRLVRHERSLGVAEARNAGIAAAAGPWLAFCDDDDLWAPDKLTRQLHAAGESERSWVYGGVVHVDAQLRVMFGAPPPPPATAVADLLHWDSVPAGASNVLARTEAVRAAGGFDPRFRHMDDWALWLRLARDGPPASVPAPVVAYRLHPGARSIDGRALEAEITLLEKVAGAQVDRLAFQRWVAGRNLQAGRWATGAAWLARASKTDRWAPRPMWANLRLFGGHLRSSVGDALLRSPAARPLDETVGAWHAEADSWLQELRSGPA